MSDKQVRHIRVLDVMEYQFNQPILSQDNVLNLAPKALVQLKEGVRLQFVFVDRTIGFSKIEEIVSLDETNSTAQNNSGETIPLRQLHHFPQLEDKAIQILIKEGISYLEIIDYLYGGLVEQTRKANNFRVLEPFE